MLGYIGLGKMGSGMVELLLERKHEVIVFDTNIDSVKQVESKGAISASSIKDVAQQLTSPRTILIMVPHSVVDEVLDKLRSTLETGDTLIDAGNSFYRESIRRAKDFESRGVHYLDVGVSGGPRGARSGACVMIGGNETVYKKHENLFKDISAENAYGYMGKSGAGHFVKMVHNGIEYGMMQAIAEGFAVMKKSEFDLKLECIANLYNHKSVIESRLINWLKDAFERYGEELDGISGVVSHTGEGKWTVEVARELGVPVPTIENAFKFRVESESKPSYTGQIVSALRNQFGGHNVEKKS